MTTPPPIAPATAPSVVIAGAASRDIAADDPRGWRLGGGVTYGALALARLGLRVRAVVGVDREAAAARELDLLRAAGVVVALAPLVSGPVFEHHEEPGGRRQHCRNASDPIEPGALPDGWIRSADAVFLAPIAAEVKSPWADAVHGRFVALGWQGLLRRIEPGRDVARVPPAPSPVLAAASLVGVSREDLEPATDAADLLALLAPGATLLLTEGDRGGRILRGATDAASPLDRRYPAVESDGVVDATGAGDVFLAAMLAAALQPSLLEGLDDPATFAAAAASLTVEGPGLFGVPDLVDVRRRAARAPSRASRRPSAASSRGSGRPSQA